MIDFTIPNYFNTSSSFWNDDQKLFDPRNIYEEPLKALHLNVNLIFVSSVKWHIRPFSRGGRDELLIEKVLYL